MTQNENKINYVLRVTQLDSSELDEFLLVHLKQTINEDFFKYIQIRFLQKYNVELLAFLRFILWYNTFYKTGQTVGQSILDWSYSKRDGFFKKLIHCCFYCLDEWIEERFSNLIKKIYIYFKSKHENEEDESNSTRIVDKYIEYLKCVIKIATFLNFLTFLYNGKYIHLWQRFVGMRPVYNKLQFMRENDTKINEREELWQSYFVLFKLINSLIDFKKLSKRVMQKLNVNENSKSSNKIVDIKKCGICNQEPTMVHCSVDFNKDTACKHVFCYYCIRKHLDENNNQYNCLICSKYINDIEIYYNKNTNI